MATMTNCRFGSVVIDIEEALRIKSSGALFEFKCLECDQLVRPHRSGGNARAHFEHLERNAACSLSHEARERDPASNDEPWADEELLASVQAYLEMQRRIKTGESFVKRQIYSALAKRFGRTPKAFEYRMQNISYVFALLGRSWVPGLNPARNVGISVASKIESLVAELEGHNSLPIIAFELAAQKATKQGIKKPQGNRNQAAKKVAVTQYDRDPEVKAWVLTQAKGICECCRLPAPFDTINGPYLEVHHVQQLADGGSDTTSNAIAICPNCHRRLHYARDAHAAIDLLYEKIHRLVREIPKAVV
ncbi:HNH endonuclease [Lysobacter enzymogenes]|uniref:HNH endonuclease n=1 Tax=Lysobacter enzymogenes TaxID=69 RepID=UPI00089BBD87|nr:HNH endonuclease signature motif containing protein [Lysobacter enzymogenes]SDX26290.1 5-methylcytosine-specific restriction enzyme A [Lysobacter enzymogenes]